MEQEDSKHPTLYDAEETCFKTFISKYAINKWKKNAHSNTAGWFICFVFIFLGYLSNSAIQK